MSDWTFIRDSTMQLWLTTMVLCCANAQYNDRQLSLQTLAPGTKIALEACSVWEPVYDFIESRGLDVCLIHPARLSLSHAAKLTGMTQL